MDNGLSRRRQGFKSPWGRQQEIKRSNVLFKAYFFAFFLFSISLPFQKPFSALVIQPGRGFLSFPPSPLHEQVD